MVVSVPILIDVSNEKELLSGVLKVITQIWPEWNSFELKNRIYTAGITNKLVGVWKENVNDQILVRVSGNNTEKFIDRENEIKSMQLVHSHGCGPKVYGKFENGLVYSFIPGRPLSRECINVEEIWSGVAKSIATVHQIKTEERKCHLFTQMRIFYELLPLKFKDDQEKRLKLAGVDREYLRKEIEDLELNLSETDFPTVLSHNDVLLENIIWDAENHKVDLIDFEFTFVNFQPFDIGNHFNEFAGVDSVDYNLYPKPEYQRRWIRRYLSYYQNVEESKIGDDEVEKMRVWANKFALASHLLWGNYALVQAHFSLLEFDYVGYALIRLGEYKKRKSEFLALKFPPEST